MLCLRLSHRRARTRAITSTILHPSPSPSHFSTLLPSSIKPSSSLSSSPLYSNSTFLPSQIQIQIAPFSTTPPPPPPPKIPNAFTNANSTNIKITKQITTYRTKRTFKPLLAFITANLKNFNDVNYSSAWTALGSASANNDYDLTSKILSSADFQQFVVATNARIEENQCYFNPRCSSNILYALASLKYSPESFSLLQNLTNNYNVDEANTQELSNLIWSLATLNYSDEDENEEKSILENVDSRSEWLFANGSPQAISNTIWGFATLDYVPINLISALCRDRTLTKRLVEKSTVQGISNTCWGFATLQVQVQVNDNDIDDDDDDNDIDVNYFFECVNSKAKWIVSNGTEQAISNIFWAFAKLKIPCVELFDEIERHRSSSLNNNTNTMTNRNSKPQHLSILLWSCATLGYASNTLFTLTKDQSDNLVMNGKINEISNTAWAFAKSNPTTPVPVPFKQLFDSIDRKARYIVERGTGHEISNIAWSYAKLNYRISSSIFTNIETHAVKIISDAKDTQVLANLCWSVAKLGYHSPTLFEEVEKRGEWLIENGTSQDVSITIWSFARLGYNCDSIISKLKLKLKTKMKYKDKDSFAYGIDGNGGSQVIVNLLWSLCALNKFEDCKELMEGLWRDAMDRDCAGFTDQEIRQLYQVRLCAYIENMDNSGSSDGGGDSDYSSSGVVLENLNNEFSKRIKHALIVRDNQNVITRQHKEISNILTSLKVTHTNEYSPFTKLIDGNGDQLDDFNSGDFWAVDIALVESKIAIEVNGRGHYVTTPGRIWDKSKGNGGGVVKLTGEYKMKERLLKKLGWRHAEVTYFDWKGVTAEEKRRRVEGIVEGKVGWVDWGR